MQKFVLLGVAAGVLFALSAGTSLYLRRAQPPSPESTGKRGPAGNGPGQVAGRWQGDPSSSAPGASLKPAVRPPYNPEADATLQMAASLTRQTEAVRAREQGLEARQKSVELAYEDVRSERTAIDELRKKLNQELAGLEVKLGTLEQKAGDLGQQQKKTSQQMDQLKRSVTEFEGVEQERLRQLASVYDAMAPTSAAKIMQQMADSGSLDTAVKILALMKDRQAAKVLAEIPDTVVATQLLEKMKGLKRPPAPGKK